MGARQNRLAVVTCDVIDSRKYLGPSRTRLNNALAQGLEFVSSIYPGVLLTDLQFRVTAGDEFQFILNAPERALDIITLLRSRLAGSSLRIPIRFRASIGVGAAKYRPARKAAAHPYEWDGPPFVLAREGLELIKRQRGPERWTSLRTGIESLDHEFDVFLGLVDCLQRKWTVAQWEAIGWTMRGLKRHEAARRIRVAHQNVSKRLNAADWPAVANALEFVQSQLAHPKTGAID